MLNINETNIIHKVKLFQKENLLENDDVFFFNPNPCLRQYFPFDKKANKHKKISTILSRVFSYLKYLNYVELCELHKGFQRKIQKYLYVKDLKLRILGFYVLKICKIVVFETLFSNKKPKAQKRTLDEKASHRWQISIPMKLY